MSKPLPTSSQRRRRRLYHAVFLSPFACVVWGGCVIDLANCSKIQHLLLLPNACAWQSGHYTPANEETFINVSAARTRNVYIGGGGRRPFFVGLVPFIVVFLHTHTRGHSWHIPRRPYASLPTEEDRSDKTISAWRACHSLVVDPRCQLLPVFPTLAGAFRCWRTLPQSCEPPIVTHLHTLDRWSENPVRITMNHCMLRN